MSQRKNVSIAPLLTVGFLLASGAFIQTLHAQESNSEEVLLALIKTAQKNPLAQAAHERTSAAYAQEQEASAHRWARVDVSAFVAPSPRIICDNADCTQTSPKEVSVNFAGVFSGLSVSVVQPLYTAGRLDLIRQAAGLATKARVAQEESLSGTIASAVARAYYGYFLSQELVWMLAEGAEHIEAGRKTLEEKLAEGDSDATVQDRYRIQTLQAEVAAKLADAEQGKAVALATIRALVGDDKYELKRGFLEVSSFSMNAFKDSNTAPPQVRAARQAAKAQRALVAYEKRSFLPNFALVGGIRFARAQGVDDAPGAFAADPFNTNSAYVAVTAKWLVAPLVQSAKLKQRQAQEREALANVAAAERLAALEDTTAKARVKQTQSRLKALWQGEKASKAWVASVLQADAIGAASAKDLADAYLAFFAARAHVLESTYQWNLAAFEMRRRSGEFSSRL